MCLNATVGCAVLDRCVATAQDKFKDERVLPPQVAGLVDPRDPGSGAV
jgi:hypothetical protein